MQAPTATCSLAEDTRLRRQVAIKTLSGTAGSDAAELRRRLLREARAAARLNHPHIAAVYDVLESDEGVHIVMEYVRGATLAARVRQGPLPPMQVLDLGIQLSGALAHAHSLGRHPSRPQAGQHHRAPRTARPRSSTSAWRGCTRSTRAACP